LIRTEVTIDERAATQSLLHSFVGRKSRKFAFLPGKIAVFR
jgi:hypothetical protein